MSLQELILLSVLSAGLIWMFRGIWIIKDWHLEHFFIRLDENARKEILTCTTFQVGFTICFLVSLGLRLYIKDISSISSEVVLSTMGHLVVDIITSIFLVGGIFLGAGLCTILLFIGGMLMEEALLLETLPSFVVKMACFFSSIFLTVILFS